MQSQGFHGRGQVPGLAAFLAVCGAVVVPLTEDEELEVEDIRLEMHTRRSTRTDPLENLGEAQCLLICRRQPGFVLVCQDGKARSNARCNDVKLFHAVEVLLLAVRLGLCEPDKAWDFYAEAVEHTGLWVLKGYPIPGSRGRFMSDAKSMSALWQVEQPPSTSTAPATQPSS